MKATSIGRPWRASPPCRPDCERQPGLGQLWPVVASMQIQVEHFVPSDIALRLALSLGVGLFVGFERGLSKKEMGVRSFAITCLLGTLSALVGGTFALASLGTVGLLIIFANVRNLMRDQNPEITTSVSLAVTAV